MSGTNIMGDPMHGKVTLKITAHTLTDLRRVRNAAVAACDAWSDGEEEYVMGARIAGLKNAYKRWEEGNR